MKDLTVIMMTPNKVPPTWAAYHRKVLEEAIGDTPIITISAKPLDWGTNLIQTEYSLTNIFKQMLRGAREAKTDFIALAEDDTLYPKEHFKFRPHPTKFGYNFNRWGIMTWKQRRPFYYLRDRIANSTMIASRELVIKALEERFIGDPAELPWWYVKELGTIPRVRSVDRYDKDSVQPFYTTNPIVSFDHDYSVDPLSQTHRKSPKPIQAFNIPKWGRARDVVKLFV